MREMHTHANDLNEIEMRIIRVYCIRGQIQFATIFFPR